MELLARGEGELFFFFQAEDGIRDRDVMEFRRVLFRSRRERALPRRRPAGAADRSNPGEGARDDAPPEGGGHGGRGAPLGRGPARHLCRVARSDPHGAVAQRAAPREPRRAARDGAGEPLRGRGDRRALPDPLRARQCAGLDVARCWRGGARARSGGETRSRRRDRPRRAARAVWAASAGRRRARRAHRRADRAARRRRAAGASAPELGRVHDPAAVRAVRGRLRSAARRGAGRRSRTRDEGRRAKPRRGDGRGRDAGGAVMYMLYTAAMLVALVLFYAPAAVAKRLRRGVPLDARARLGLGGAAPSRGARAGWLHAVSVGEAIAAAPLVEGLRRLWPALPLVMTTVTKTGATVVRERYAGLASHRFFPLDLPWATRRFVASLDPAFLVCMETELWPNMLRTLAARGVPVMIANGRVSDRSYRRYR